MTTKKSEQCKKWRIFNGKISFCYLLIILTVPMFLFVVRNFRVEYFALTMKEDDENSIILATSYVNLTHAFSIDIVPLSVYFDLRPQQDYDNATVIFLSLLKAYRRNILGCEVDGIEELKPRVVDIILSGWIEVNSPVTHMDCIVYCYDMDINEHSKVSLIYSKNSMVLKEPVRTVVVIPKYDEEEDAVMVCATGFGAIPNIDLWLTYQQTVGIKFIHINIHPSFLVNLSKSSVLKKFVASGYVNMTVWEEYLNKSQVFYYSQSFKYHDCILRYQGRYKYMMVIDFDEYFIPFGDKKDVHSYAVNLIKENVGSIVLSRQIYFCKARGFKDMAVPRDGNLTKLYDTSQSFHENMGKSIHLVKVIEQSSVHRAGALLKPYTRLSFRKSPQSSQCQIAHIKNNIKKPCKY